MNNVFADIINKISQRGQNISKGTVQALLDIAQKNPVKNINPNTALQQVRDMASNFSAKIQKGAVPIGNMKDGSILFSDGSIKQPAEATKYNQQLNILRDNVLAQGNYTPQTIEYLKSIPINSSSDDSMFGRYTGEMKYPIAQKKSGGAIFDESKTIAPRIVINPRVFSSTPEMPGQVLSHEYMHALDANVNKFGEASYIPTKDATGDSYGFMPKLNSESEAMKKQIDDFLTHYNTQDQPQLADTEGYAQYGAIKGNKTLLGPAKDNYSSVFNPSSKNINASYKYPTTNTYSDIINKLFTNK